MQPRLSAPCAVWRIRYWKTTRSRSRFCSSASCGAAFRWPAGTFVNNEKYKCIMMAMKTTLDVTGCHFEVPTGTADEVASLDASYEHLCKMRDELVTLNIVPPVSEWSKINPNL